MKNIILTAVIAGCSVLTLVSCQKEITPQSTDNMNTLMSVFQIHSPYAMETRYRAQIDEDGEVCCPEDDGNCSGPPVVVTPDKLSAFNIAVQSNSFVQFLQNNPDVEQKLIAANSLMSQMINSIKSGTNDIMLYSTYPNSSLLLIGSKPVTDSTFLVSLSVRSKP